MAAEILAKDTPETLSDHVSACIHSAKDIIPFIALPESEKLRLYDDVILALALHDVGKAATGFQDMLNAKTSDWHGWRHEILSASFASAIPSVSEAIIFAILTHHKSIPNSFIRSERRALNFEEIPLGEAQEFSTWRKMKKEWLDNREAFRKSWVRICNMIGRQDLVDYGSLAELRLDEAWLIRGADPYGQLRKKSYEDRRYFSLVRGLLMACDHMASGHYNPTTVQIRDLLKNSSTKLHQSISPRIFQSAMANSLDSVILRAPTGSGKTEAALLWAGRNSGSYSRLLYVLPNIASINAMFGRLKRLYPNEAVGLLHSRARGEIYRSLDAGEDLESRPYNQKTASMLSSLARSIWFPVRVCTPHQVLRFSLRGRGWETMLAEFPNSVFVFDEIHAYDPRLVGQIIGTAKLVSNWNAKCAFLSATMPQFLIDIIKQHTTPVDSKPLELITPDSRADRDIMEKKRHRLIDDNGSLLDFIPAIVEDMTRGYKVLIVCNTVNASQKVFREICGRLGKKNDSGLEQEIMLIHSRFTRRDRFEKEQLIMSEGSQPKILIATQVVEVSLNIDYDIGYFEPAPIDALVQRMGRVNRFGKKDRPAPIHLMSEEISTHSVYKNRERVDHTLAELRSLSKNDHAVSEADIIAIADTVYKTGFNADESYAFESGLKNIELTNFEHEMLAGASEDWKEVVLGDDMGIDVLPEALSESFSSFKEKKLFVEAYDFLIPLQYWSLQRYNAHKGDDVIIIDWPYSKSSGLAVEEGDNTDNELVGSVSSTPPNVI